MITRPVRLAPVVLVLLSACGGKTVDVPLSDDMQYAFSSSIEAGCVTVPAKEDSLVDWSALTTDLLGDAMDPTTDVSKVGIGRSPNLTREEVLQGINDSSLLSSDIPYGAFYTPAAGETSAPLSAFEVQGTHVNPPEDILSDGGTYLVNVVSGTSQYRMFGFFCPEDGAPEATIAVTPDSATLSYTVDLAAGAPIGIPSGAKHAIVDWAGLTTTGSGQPIHLGDVDRMLVGEYSASTADLEADFLHVEQLADRTWSADVEGVGEWDLFDAEDANEDEFPGFEDGKTYLLALECTTCLNPAPPFLGVLQPQ